MTTPFSKNYRKTLSSTLLLFLRKCQGSEPLLYDDIEKEPRTVLIKVCNFLEVDPKSLPDDTNVDRRLNTVPACDAPREIVSLLKDIFDDQITYIDNRFSRDFRNS